MEFRIISEISLCRLHGTLPADSGYTGRSEGNG